MPASEWQVDEEAEGKEGDDDDVNLFCPMSHFCTPSGRKVVL